MPKVRLTKAEKKAAALEKANQLKREHIGREIRYGQITLRRHEKSWKKMLLDIALPRMRGELEYAWHTYERVIDAKDFTISLLMDELDQAEDQYMRNYRTHIDNIDNLITLCYDQIQDLRNLSKDVIQNLYTAATFERMDFLGITKENEEYLKTMLFMLENQKKESEKLIRGEYLSRQDVEVSKLTDVCSKFIEELEEKYTRVYRESLELLKESIADSAARKNEVNALYKQDDYMQKIIRMLWMKIRKLMDYIKNMKRTFDDFQISQARKVNELVDERAYYEQRFKTFKAIFDQEKHLDENNLTQLTLNCNSTVRYLEEIEKKGEKILKLTAICRKYETLQEKTMTFPLYDFKSKLAPLESIDWREIEGYRPELEIFCNRVGQVEASRYKIKEDLRFLEKENMNLRNKIHEYCACLNCDSAVVVEESHSN